MATYGIKMVIGDSKMVVKSGLGKVEAHELANETNAKAEENGLAKNMKAVVFIEMNAHEKEVDRLISNAVSECIGGFENQLYDSLEGSEEWLAAKATLNHDTLFDMIYDEVMYYSSNKRHASHIRFAGKAFIEERIERRLAKEGCGK